MRNGEQKNYTCKVGQKGSPLDLKKMKIYDLFQAGMSHFESPFTQPTNGQTPKSQTMLNKEKNTEQTRKVTWKQTRISFIWMFTGINGPHKGVWRFDLNDIWNGSHIQLGGHSWKEILHIKTHKDNRMYLKLLNKFKPLKHSHPYLQMWSDLICLEIALFRQASIKTQFHRMSENFGHPASQTE